MTFTTNRWVTTRKVAPSFSRHMAEPEGDQGHGRRLAQQASSTRGDTQPRLWATRTGRPFQQYRRDVRMDDSSTYMREPPWFRQGLRASVGHHGARVLAVFERQDNHGPHLPAGTSLSTALQDSICRPRGRHDQLQHLRQQERKPRGDGKGWVCKHPAHESAQVGKGGRLQPVLSDGRVPFYDSRAPDPSTVDPAR